MIICPPVREMNIDIIAYQDGVGVNHTALEDSARFYEILYKAHEKASRARLWADMELFYLKMGTEAICCLPTSTNALSGRWRISLRL